ncbi:MAG: GIY-YIG nuclease family protein, partial [Anaerolineales bacterium]|nr:GIY-YIG nuclease family protein [Anaerolineales bacterium]
LYIGMTGDLNVRVNEHKEKRYQQSFTAKYNVNQLVYFEVFDDPHEAARRERQLKGWRRDRKIALIKSMNPQWRDLSQDLE